MEPLKEPDNEGEYLEMADHLKKLYDEVDLKNQKLTLEKMELQKILMSAYGLSRVIDNLVGHLMEVPGDLVMLVHAWLPFRRVRYSCIQYKRFNF